MHTSINRVIKCFTFIGQFFTAIELAVSYYNLCVFYLSVLAKIPSLSWVLWKRCETFLCMPNSCCYC